MTGRAGVGTACVSGGQDFRHSPPREKHLKSEGNTVAPFLAPHPICLQANPQAPVCTLSQRGDFYYIKHVG